MKTASKDRLILALYIVVFASFIIVVKFHEIGYNDLWLLDGILIPTLIFIFLSLAAEMFVSDNRFVAIIGAFFVAGICLIPGLKYQLFYGVYDSVEHYGVVNNLVSSGNVPLTGDFAPTYSNIPGIHIFLSSFVIVAGFSVDQVMKFIFPVIYGTIPLLIFSITNGLLEKNVQKYVLIASTFPLVVPTAYGVTGSTFGLLLYFLFLVSFFCRSLVEESRVRFSIVLLLLGFSLVISHGVTSFFLTFLMVVIPLVLTLAKTLRKSLPITSVARDYFVPSFFLAVLIATWWMFKALFFFRSFAGILRSVFFTKEMAEIVPSRFFAIPLLDKLKIITVLQLKDIMLGMISLIGLCVLVVMFRRKNLASKAEVFYLNVVLFLSVIVAAVAFEFAVGYGGTGYSRYLNFALVLSPFLAGLALLHLDTHLFNIIKRITTKNLAMTCVLFALFSLCLVEVFPYQPLVPRANVLSKDLPGNVYLLYVTGVNTIYQKNMILFAERFSAPDARIASDITTRFQIYGFADPSFSSRNIWYSPLENPNLKWDLFLLHTNEKAAPFNEMAEFHTPEHVNGFRETTNIVYDNGMSIIVSYGYTMQKG